MNERSDLVGLPCPKSGRKDGLSNCDKGRVWIGGSWPDLECCRLTGDTGFESNTLSGLGYIADGSCENEFR